MQLSMLATMLVKNLEERREKVMDSVLEPGFQLVIELDLVSVEQTAPGWVMD